MTNVILLLLYLECMEKINVIYVRFDKNLDYKQVVNSYPIHKILESAFGDIPNMVSPTKYTFDRDKLGVFIQDQWESSKTYTVDEGTLPVNITRGYYDKINQFFNPNMDGHLLYEEFEPEILLDDHLVVITFCDKVLGVFATEYDFEKLINEINNE